MSKLLCFSTIFLSVASLAAQDSAPLAAWTPTAALTEARHSSCAVALPDGRILVTGGTGLNGDLATTELYLLEATFLPAAPMTVARSRHSCTLLKDGRVLVTGGNADGSAELYDPQTDTWQPLASTAQPRSGHTATLLVDGRVLIAGGAAANTPLDSIDLFDPIANTITRATAVLATARAGHSAVSLPGGRLLLIAGRGADGHLSSTELFNPDDDTIAAGPPL